MTVLSPLWQGDSSHSPCDGRAAGWQKPMIGDFARLEGLRPLPAHLVGDVDVHNAFLVSFIEIYEYIRLCRRQRSPRVPACPDKPAW
jgi:hypothetical protein